MARTYEALERAQAGLLDTNNEPVQQKKPNRFTGFGRGSSKVQNQLKNIASALLDLADGEKKSFLVTSASRDEKIKPLVYHLVCSFARNTPGKSVLLVDNIHQLSVLCKDFSSESSRYITNKNEEETIINNFTYVPTIDESHNNFDYSRNLNVSEIKKFINLCNNHYDFVFFSNYEWSEISDIVSFVKEIDHVVMVVEAGKTNSEIVNYQKNIITEAGGSVAGVILNNRRYYIPEYIYKFL